MPPKEQKQLTKAQKERLKREEEEKKRQEEEEARLKVEQEEKERLKREKKEIERKKEQEKNELTQRVQELDELRDIQNKSHKIINEINNNRRKQERWSRYMLCDGSPDPTISQEINTYMNLWREDNSRVLIKDVLEDSELCLKLIDELDYKLTDLSAEEEIKVYEKELQYNESKVELMELLKSKLERACHEMLLRASDMKDSETLNFQMTWKNVQIKLCLWGNLSFNPRIKSFIFLDEGISFDIPKILQQKECAYQILLTTFDHYSPLAKSYLPRRQKSLQVEETPKVEEMEVVTETKAEVTEEAEAMDLSTAIKEKNMDLLAELSKMEAEAAAAAAAQDEVEPEIVEEEVEPPEEDRLTSPIPMEYDDFDGDVDVLDMREFQSLGGTITFNIVSLPPQSKIVGSWHLFQQIQPPKLVPFPYEADEFPDVIKTELDVHNSPEGSEEKKPSKTSSSLTNKDIEKKEEKPPITVTIRLPEKVTFCDKPHLARWDETIHEWRTQGIVIRDYKEHEKSLTFQTRVFGTLALFQETHINMPFQSWELRPYHTKADFFEEFIDISDEMFMMDTSKTSVSGSRRPSGTEITARVNSRIGGEVTPVGEPDALQEAFPVVSPPSKGNLTKRSQMSATSTVAGGEGPAKGVHKKRLNNINHSLLTIVAAVNEVKIEIMGKKVTIVPDLEKPELNHLAGTWFSVRELKQQMQAAGVNIFPQEDSMKYVAKTNKNLIAEERLYEQMAMLSPAMAFSWSRWNTECGQSERIIVQAVEHLDGMKNVDEEAWKLFAVTRKKVEKLKMNEFDEEFNDEKDENTSFHANFYHMYKELAMKEGFERVKEADCEYVDTVNELLKSIKFIGFS